jgi:ABC-type bacteriocin/lantibiotic exporter with double-glycine peptidase domain
MGLHLATTRQTTQLTFPFIIFEYFRIILLIITVPLLLVAVAFAAAAIGIFWQAVHSITHQRTSRNSTK